MVIMIFFFLQNLVNLSHFFPMKDPVYIGPNHILEVKICWNFAQKINHQCKVKQMAKRVTKMRAHMRWQLNNFRNVFCLLVLPSVKSDLTFCFVFIFSWHPISTWRVSHEIIFLMTSSFMKIRGLSHSGLAIYTKKDLKAKEELWKLKYFTMQKYIIFKKSSKRNQNPSRYYNSI